MVVNAMDYASAYMFGQGARASAKYNRPTIPWTELEEAGLSATFRVIFPPTRGFLGAMPGFSYASYSVDHLKGPIGKDGRTPQKAWASAMAPAYFGLPDVISDVYKQLSVDDARSKLYAYTYRTVLPVFWINPPSGMPRIALCDLSRRTYNDNIVATLRTVMSNVGDTRDPFVAMTDFDNGYDITIRPSGRQLDRKYHVNVATQPSKLNLSEEQCKRMNDQLCNLDLTTVMQTVVWHPEVAAGIIRGEYDWRAAQPLCASVRNLLPRVFCRCKEANDGNEPTDPYRKYQPWPGDSAFEDMPIATPYLAKHGYSIEAARDEFVRETGIYTFTRTELNQLCDLSVYGPAYTAVTGRPWEPYAEMLGISLNQGSSSAGGGGAAASPDDELPM